MGVGEVVANVVGGGLAVEVDGRWEDEEGVGDINDSSRCSSVLFTDSIAIGTDVDAVADTGGGNAVAGTGTGGSCDDTPADGMMTAVATEKSGTHSSSSSTPSSSFSFRTGA